MTSGPPKFTPSSQDQPAHSLENSLENSPAHSLKPDPKRLTEKHGGSRFFQGATVIAAGIFVSRVAGFARERVFAHYFGNSDSGDAFKAALKIPNFLQNLFGEGILSASFIPVYSQLVAKEERQEAGRVAGAILSLLALAVSLLVAAGVVLTPFLIDVIAPGFHGEKRALTIRLVQIFFPGTGLLVFSAWCLGILNSHRKFFLPYAAPVILNAAVIASLLYFGGRVAEPELAVWAAWGLVGGSLLQVLIQLPTALRLIPTIKIQMGRSNAAVKTVVKNFVPVVVSRGAVQVSAYIDNVLASLLPTGAVSSLAYAQTIYLLPVSLFGMSVSAAELPTMSQATGTTEEIYAFLNQRLTSGLRRIAFFIIPFACGFLVLGDVLVAAIYQTGQFTRTDTLQVWSVLAGSSVGLLASTMGRLYSSTFYALKDTRTPLRFALLRVGLTTVLGYVCALYVPRWLGIDIFYGAAGLTASAGVAGWLEFILLRRALRKRIGPQPPQLFILSQLWASSVISCGVGYVFKSMSADRGYNPLVTAAVVFAPTVACYLLVTSLIGVPEVAGIVKRLRLLLRI